MSYLKIKVHCPETQLQSIIALYSQLENASFEETNFGCYIYLPKRDWEEAGKDFNRQINDLFDHEISVEEMVSKNWNELWEQSFEPVLIDDFCQLRADFHSPNPTIKYDLVISPKLAFGTGHHETTYMMLLEMSKHNFLNKSVLDFGCGTAVLAILAELMGAEELLAIDYDQNAVENSIENISLNNCNKIEVRKASIENLKAQAYNFVFANINRQVLLNSMALFGDFLKSDGLLFMSGILQQDFALIKNAADQSNLKLQSQNQKGDWLCLIFSKIH